MSSDVKKRGNPILKKKYHDRFLKEISEYENDPIENVMIFCNDLNDPIHIEVYLMG